MTWDAFALAIIAAAGVAGLLLTQVRDVLMKVVEVLDAWNLVRRSWITRRGERPAEEEGAEG
ncbi:hypothetical protein Sme01_46010 [Sphaerisporangium melleum]|uniref:Uncharacterized protein n=1 Tax=Sphaerisporangium melleum TaxID=321316 RepID=A0A917R0H0_9ACTN|nr:hypothetical protein [Sphaerisporangium melleum]GGK79828.1 hypothetical protein GCM10007964_23070 [Sphaerisporangium melleum]GII72125.1 hypothetical protein Sme01_46010 [Sphaerisporangium melleum]